MRLTPREQERLLTHAAGELAEGRLSRGIKLNYPEAVAFITSRLMERAREGATVAELMTEGAEILRPCDVMPGVAEILHEIQFEATFPDGTKLVTVHNPIVAAGDVKPGEFFPAEGDIVINEGRETAEIDVVNRADRPVQVGSHVHFFEVNKKLDFDRELAFGFRLDIPSGTATRFEPGETKRVRLVKIGGRRLGGGLNALTRAGGSFDDASVKADALKNARGRGFLGVRGDV